MNECERIIKKGVIPRSFFKEEVRDDFLITVERKKIWAVELDILFEIIRILKKYDMKYYFAGGNLLGAIRHGGFIPWDDDIDILLFRSDYDRFCELCKDELEAPYFFQTTITENNCWCNTARICNSNTTGIRRPLIKKENVNKGIFVDIIPLDAINNNSIFQMFIQKIVRFKTVIANAYSFNMNRSILTRFTHWFLNQKWVKFDLKKWYINTNRLAAITKWDKANKIGIVMWTPYKPEKVTWNKKDFDQLEEVSYEFFKILIPSGYDNILTVQFGDYMKFPPIEQRGGWHDIVFCPDIPYTEYCMIHNNDNDDDGRI